MLTRIHALWNSHTLGRSLLEWADLAEWDLDLWHERRQLRACVIILMLTALTLMSLGWALFLPLYGLIGCLC